MMRVQVKEGEMTKTIYSHIMEQKYDKAWGLHAPLKASAKYHQGVVDWEV